MGFRRLSGCKLTRTLAVPLLLAVGLSSCDLAGSLTDVGGALANPDAALLDSPGRRLATGSYRNLLVDGSLENGGHVVAIRTDREQSEVAIFPYLDGDGCFINPGLRIERISSRVDVELSGMLAVQRNEDESGKGTISFVDFDCDEITSLEDATLPQFEFPADEPRGLLTITDDGHLYLIDARSQQLVPIAENAGSARTSSNTLWTIEEGQLVARDKNLEEFARVGTNVVEYVISGGARITVAFRDEEGVFTWSDRDGTTPISETGCALMTWGPDSLAFTEPCEGGDLRIYTIGSRIGVDDDFIEIAAPSGISWPQRSLFFWNQGTRPSEILFTLWDSEQVGDRLMLARIDEDSRGEDGLYVPEVELVSDESAVIRGGQIYLNWDGTTGTLVELERDDDSALIGLREIAKKVVQLPGGSPYASEGILMDFEEGRGTLRVYEKEGDKISSTIIAEDVPVQNHFGDEGSRTVFIADSEDGSVGSLYIAETSRNDPIPDVQRVARNVYLDTARFLEQPSGIAYLAREEGRDFATLRVYLVDSGLTLTIQQSVSEYRTVPWPAPGILYAVPEGDKRGLWFSKAR